MPNTKLILIALFISALCNIYPCALAAGTNLPFKADVATTIRMKSTTVNVYRPLVTISDIADITSSSKEMVKLIGELDIDVFEDDQTTIKISRQQLLMRVRIAGINDARVDVRGPSVLTVKRSARSHPANTLKQAITDSIAKQFGIERQDIRVSLIDAVVANTYLELAQNMDSAIVVLPTDLPLGETKVRFIYKTEFENGKTLELGCRITMLQEMLIAKKHLPRGTTISATDVRLVKRPLDDNKLIPASFSQIVGRRTNTNIPMHGVVRTSDLTETAKRPIVQRNDIVDVVITKGGLNLRLKNAKVLTPGYEGDTVQVLNTESNKKLTASVVNKSLVEIR